VKTTRRSFVPADKCATVHSKQRIHKASDEKIKDRRYYSTVYSTTCIYMVSTLGVSPLHSYQSSQCWIVVLIDSCAMYHEPRSWDGERQSYRCSCQHLARTSRWIFRSYWCCCRTELADDVHGAMSSDPIRPCISPTHMHNNAAMIFFSFVLRWTLHSLENWNIPSIERINWHIHQDSV
jgi:hypothetical protein